MIKNIQKGFARLMPLFMIGILVSSLFLFFAVQQSTVAPVYAANTLSSSTYIDADSDGQVDHIKWTFDTNITQCIYVGGDWSVNTAGTINVSAITGIDKGDPEGTGDGSCDNTDAVIYISVTANADVTGGGTDPQITYTNSGSNNLQDFSTIITSKGPITNTDDAAALVTTRVTKDTDQVDGSAGTVSGTMNGILATFTEAMDASTGASTDFAITLNDDSGLTETYGDTTDDTTLFFGCTDCTAADTSDLLKLQITGGDGIQDLAGISAVAEGATVAATDGATPYLISGTYDDSNTDGTIDEIVLVLSENTTFTFAGADWAFGVAGDMTMAGDFLPGDCTGSGGTTITCTDADNSDVTADAGETGASIQPRWDYTNNSNNISDGTNNTASVNTTLADGVAPIYVSSTTLDNDNDGTVDYIKVVYSENLDDTSVIAGDFETGIADTTAGNLIETFASLTPATGNEIDVANDAIIYIGVTFGSEIILANKTDYTLKIAQTGAVDDANSNTLASFSEKTSADGAAPYMISATYSDSGGTVGTVDQVVFEFTENTTFTTITAADWLFATAGDINLAGDFIIGDCSGSGTATVTCTDTDNSSITADANETGKQTTGGAEPDLTYVNNTGDINDGTNNTPGFTITLTDDATPIAVSATMDYNDNVADLVVTFSETIDASATTASGFHINDITGTDDVNLSVAPADVDAATLTFTLTETERVSALAISGVTGGNGGAVVLDIDALSFTDMLAISNAIDDNNTVIETADTNPPAVTSATMDYTDGIADLIVTFSETIDASATIASGFHLNDITGTDDVNLSVAPADVDAATLTFTLTEAQRVDALALSGVAGGNGGAVVLDVDTGSITDIATTSSTSDDDNNTVTETADLKNPILNSWQLDMDVETLTMVFDETADASALLAGQIIIQDLSAAPTANYTLTTSSTSSSDGTTIVIDISTADAEAIKLDTGLGVSQASSFLSITATAIDDMAGNGVTAIGTGTAQQASAYIGDTTDANLTSWQLDMNAETLTMVFDEPVDVTTLLVGQITLQDALTATTSHTLTTSSTSSSNGSTIVIDLISADSEAIKLNTGLGTATSDSFLVITGITIDDMEGNAVTAIIDTAAQQASGHTPDTTGPALLNWDLDLSLSTLTMNFDEPVDAGTLNTTVITLQNAALIGASFYTLTVDSSTASSNGTQIVIDIGPIDLAAIQAISNLATVQSDSWLSMTTGVIDDMATNDNAVIANTAGMNVTAYTAGFPGTLTPTDVALSSYWINGDVAATITFTNSTPIPDNAKIVIVFPVGFDVTGVNSVTSPDVSIDGTLGVTNDGVDTVTIVRSIGTGTLTPASTAVKLMLTTVKNPSAPGTTGTYTFQTQTSLGSVLDEDTAVPGDIIIDPSATTTTTTTTTSGGGGGGGGSAPPTNTDSNTTTSTIAIKIDTSEASLTYSRPVQFNADQITVDVDSNISTVQATGDNGTLTIKPNSKSTVLLYIPPNTTITADANWLGRINPPLIRSLTNIHASGEVINGTDELLERGDVAVLVEVGDGTELTFSNDVTLTIPTDLPDGSIVNVYFSSDEKTWDGMGTAVVQDGKVVVMTSHLSYFALEMTDETATIVGDIEEAEAMAPAFYDITGHWAESYINELASLGVVSGKTSTMFAPNDNITRAELTKIALKALNYSVDPSVGDTYFSDVSSSDWYAPYVVAAKNSGIVKGYEGNIFSPNGYVNRAETLKIFIEAAGFAGVDTNFQTNYASKDGWYYVFFPDVLMGEWYAKYVAYAKDFGIVGGYSDGTFRAGNNITRAEVSKIIMNILDMQ